MGTIDVDTPLETFGIQDTPPESPETLMTLCEIASWVLSLFPLFFFLETRINRRFGEARVHFPKARDHIPKMDQKMTDTDPSVVLKFSHEEFLLCHIFKRGMVPPDLAYCGPRNTHTFALKDSEPYSAVAGAVKRLSEYELPKDQVNQVARWILDTMTSGTAIARGYIVFFSEPTFTVHVILETE